MWKPDSPATPGQNVQRVAIRDFPFGQAILLEECPWKDVKEMQKHYKGSVVFLVATAMRPQFADVLEEAQDSLVGFLVGDVDRDEDGDVHGSLVNLAVSLLEEPPDSVRVALIRQWQEECRWEMWDGLRASILPTQEKEQELFSQEGFQHVGTCSCCDAEIFQWKSSEE